MVFGTGGAAGWGARTGLVGRDAALVALSGATLTEGDFRTGLAAGLTTGFITDLATCFLLMTSLVVDFLTGGTFLRVTGLSFAGVTLAVVFNTGFTIFLAATLLIGFLAAGLATVLAATFTGVLLFMAGVFTSCLLWAVACG